MQLAANWPDKSKGLVISSDCLGNPSNRMTRGKQAKAVQPERLSEETFQFGWVNKRSDSPNPERLIQAVDLWNKGLVWKKISEETSIPERTVRRYLRKMGFIRDQKFVASKLNNVPKTKDHKDKISTVRIERGVAKGENNPNWKGGIKNPENDIRKTIEYKLWRTSIFVRDEYCCKGCGIQNGDGKTIVFEAHHILPRRDFPHLTFDLSNGITLCKKCHNKTKKKEYLSINIWRQRVDSKKIV